MDTLLQLQELDLRIERIKAREVEIPKQKSKFEIHKRRLADELKQSEDRCKKLQIEQRECEGEIDQKQAQIKKYDGQLLGVKKNDEYQALLHEMDLLKKQIGIKEERIITIMVELDDAKAHLEADRKRINDELKGIEEECAKIDAELAAAIEERKRLEALRVPLAERMTPDLMSRYTRIRRSIKTGPAVVPLNDEHCTGCHMAVPAQTVNELIGGQKIHSCNHCGRLLYHAENFRGPAAEVEA